MRNTKRFIKIINWIAFISFVAIGVTGAVFLALPGASIKHGAIMLAVGFSVSAMHFVTFSLLSRRNTLEVIKGISQADFETKITTQQQRQSGIINFDNNGRIVYITEWLAKTSFKKYLGRNIDTLGTDWSPEDEMVIELEQHVYRLFKNVRSKTIHVVDISEIRLLEQIIENKQHVVSVFRIDYSNKVIYSSSDYTAITAKLYKAIESWPAKTAGTLSHSHSGEEVVVVSEWGLSKPWFDKSGKFFDQFEQLKEDRKDVIISVGVSTNNRTVAELTNDARIQLRESIARGGNIISLNNAGHKKFIGLSLIGYNEKSEVQITFFKSILERKIINAKNIIISSHHFADADAVASVMGMIHIAKKYRKQVMFYLDTFDRTGKSAYDELATDFTENMIKKTQLSKYIGKNTLLIVTDTTDKERIQLPNKYIDLIPVNNRVIVDHHRVSTETLLTDIDSIMLDTRASSSAEIVTDIISHTSNAAVEEMIGPKLAQLLALGIYTDTNGLSKNVGYSTFENIAYLTKAGADVKQLSGYMKISKTQMEHMEQLYKSLKIQKNRFAVSTLDSKVELDDDVISSMANKLLDFDGIDASFVIAKNKNGMIKISGRSTPKVNVQNIMEQMGGGGHFDMAAAALPAKVGLSNAESRLIKILKDVE